MIPDPPPHFPRPRPDWRDTRPPKSKSKILYVLWRIQMWVEGTFGMHVMEPWEKMIVLSIFIVLLALLFTGFIRLLSQVSAMRSRMAYYLWGREREERQLLQWIGNNVAASGQKNAAEGLRGEF